MLPSQSREINQRLEQIRALFKQHARYCQYVILDLFTSVIEHDLNPNQQIVLRRHAALSFSSWTVRGHFRDILDIQRLDLNGMGTITIGRT